MGAPAGDIP